MADFRRTLVRSLAASALAAAAVAAGTGVAVADDHLAGAASSSGADDRGFTNPVAGNPSGTAGQASQPGTVPGLGSPNAGTDLGTPAFSCDSLQERLVARSSGVGPSCG